MHTAHRVGARRAAADVCLTRAGHVAVSSKEDRAQPAVSGIIARIPQ